MTTIRRWAINTFVFFAIIFGGCLVGALAIVARIAERMDRRAARAR